MIKSSLTFYFLITILVINLIFVAILSNVRIRKTFFFKIMTIILGNRFKKATKRLKKVGAWLEFYRQEHERRVKAANVIQKAWRRWLVS